MLISNVTKFVGFLFLLNFIGILIWPFDLVMIRLSLWTISGLTLLILFLIYIKGQTLLGFKFFLLQFIIVGLFNSQGFRLPLIFLDLCFMGLLASSVLLKKLDFNHIRVATNIVFLLGVSFIIITIPYLNFSVIFNENEYSRSDTGIDFVSGNRDIGYYITVVHGMIVNIFGILILLLPLLKDQIKTIYLRIIFIFILAAYVFYSLYYLKRQALTELFVILSIYVLLYRKLSDSIMPKSVFRLAFFVIILFAVFSSQVFSSLMERYSESLQDIRNFDRIEELRLVFSDFTIIDFIFGKGIAYVYGHGYGGGSLVHIGFANTVFKGGVVLLLFYLYNLLKNFFYCLKRSNTNSNFLVGSGFSLFIFIHLLIAPGYGSTVNVLFVSLGLFSRYPLIYLLEKNTQKE